MGAEPSEGVLVSPRVVPDESVTVAGLIFTVDRRIVTVSERMIGPGVVFERLTKPAIGVETQVDSPRWFIFDSGERADEVLETIVGRLEEMRAADQRARDFRNIRSKDRAVAEAERAGESDLVVAFARRWGGTSTDPNAGPSGDFLWKQLEPALPTDRPSFSEVRDRVNSRRQAKVDEAAVEREFTDAELKAMSDDRLFEMISGAPTVADRTRAQQLYEKRTGGGGGATVATDGGAPDTAVATDSGGGGGSGGGDGLQPSTTDVGELTEGGDATFSMDRLVGAIGSGEIDLVMSELAKIDPIVVVAGIGLVALAWATLSGSDFGSKSL